MVELFSLREYEKKNLLLEEQIQYTRAILCYLRRLINFCLLHFLRPKELQPQVIDQGLELVVHGGVQEAGGAEEGDGVFLDRFSCWLRLVTDEPVSDVDVVLQILGGGVLVQDRADGDAEFWVLGQLFGPVLESIDVGESDDLAAHQDQEPVIDAGFAAGGQPEVAGHQAGADDGRLL